MKIHIGPYRKNRKVDVKLHPYDTWNMDTTLALIIVPMLKQLKETKHGCPYIDDEDLPDGFSKDIEERWNYVIDSMLWAFEQKITEKNWEDQYFISYGEFTTEPLENQEGFSKLVWLKEPEYDAEGIKKHQEKMNYGFKLFGKYYENLWD